VALGGLRLALAVFHYERLWDGEVGALEQCGDDAGAKIALPVILALLEQLVLHLARQLLERHGVAHLPALRGHR